jgi:hypothetical protein
VSISSARFRALSLRQDKSGLLAAATSQKTGFGSVVSSGQLGGTGGSPAVIQMADLQFVPYQAAAPPVEDGRERYPMLRYVNHHASFH